MVSQCKENIFPEISFVTKVYDHNKIVYVHDVLTPFYVCFDKKNEWSPKQHMVEQFKNWYSSVKYSKKWKKF